METSPGLRGVGHAPKWSDRCAGCDRRAVGSGCDWLQWGSGAAPPSARSTKSAITPANISGFVSSTMLQLPGLEPGGDGTRARLRGARRQAHRARRQELRRGVVHDPAVRRHRGRRATIHGPSGTIFVVVAGASNPVLLGFDLDGVRHCNAAMDTCAPSSVRISETAAGRRPRRSSTGTRSWRTEPARSTPSTQRARPAACHRSGPRSAHRCGARQRVSRRAASAHGGERHRLRPGQRRRDRPSAGVRRAIGRAALDRIARTVDGARDAERRQRRHRVRAHGLGGGRVQRQRLWLGDLSRGCTASCRRPATRPARSSARRRSTARWSTRPTPLVGSTHRPTAGRGPPPVNPRSAARSTRPGRCGRRIASRPASPTACSSCSPVESSGGAGHSLLLALDTCRRQSACRLRPRRRAASARGSPTRRWRRRALSTPPSPAVARGRARAARAAAGIAVASPLALSPAFSPSTSTTSCVAPPARTRSRSTMSGGGRGHGRAGGADTTDPRAPPRVNTCS